MESKTGLRPWVWLNARVSPEVRRAVKQRSVDTDTPMAEVVESVLRRALKIPTRPETKAQS